MTQKYETGDLVHIAKDLGTSMAHFTNDKDAIVLGSYSDLYGGENYTSYSLHIKDQGSCSWYNEAQLTLIKEGQVKLLREWKDEEKRIEKESSDLDWIFANPEKLTGTSIQVLFTCLGGGSLWGKSGEGYTYYLNSLQTNEICKPFLDTNDKDGFLKFCELAVKK